MYFSDDVLCQHVALLAYPALRPVVLGMDGYNVPNNQKMVWVGSFFLPWVVVGVQIFSGCLHYQ